MSALGLNATWGRTDFAAYVLDHLASQSALLRGGARSVPVTGKSLKIPRVLSDGSASWVAEGAEIPSSAPTGDLIELIPKKLANTVSLSNESIADAATNELDQVGLALVRAVATAIDARVFSASAASATAPAGLLSYSLPTGIGAVSIDNIIRAVGVIEAAGGVATTVWVNPADLTDLRLTKVAAGSNQPVLEPDLQAAGAERIAGATLIPTPALATGKAIVADAAQVILGIRKDAEVQFSADAKFTADSVVARVIARVDLAINDTNGLVLLQAA